MEESYWMIDPSIIYSSMSEAGKCISVRNNIKATDEVLSDGGKFFLPFTTYNSISEAGRYIGVCNDIRATDEVFSHGGRYFLY